MHGGIRWRRIQSLERQAMDLHQHIHGPVLPAGGIIAGRLTGSKTRDQRRRKAMPRRPVAQAQIPRERRAGIIQHIGKRRHARLQAGKPALGQSVSRQGRTICRQGARERIRQAIGKIEGPAIVLSLRRTDPEG